MIPGIIASFKRFAEVGEELVSARYWRLYMDEGRGSNNNYVTLTSVDFLDSSGQRIAPSGGTAFASSIYSAAENADKAFDGLSNTVWTTTTTSPAYPHYVGYDFGAGNVMEVAGISVANRVNYTLGIPLHSWLQWSNDGIEWTNYIELYWGPKDSWGLQARTALSSGVILGPSEATKWRIAFPVISPAGNQNAVGMSELIMRAAPGGARILPIDYYCSQYDTPAANAFDANNGTQWTTADGIAKPTGGHFLIVTLAEPAAIKQLEMMARQDNYYNEWPTTVVVSYFDGFKWVEYWRRDDNTVPPTNGLSRVITMPGVDTGRSKWRFRVNTTQGNGSWVTIPELELRDAYGGADLTKPNGALDSSDPYGTSLKNLINDTTASYQSGRSTYNGPIYFDYDFGRDVTIREVKISGSSTAGDNPATGDVLYYNNETAQWVIAWSFVSGTWASGEVKLLRDGHRYWRVRCTNDQTFFALTQLQMRTRAGEDVAPLGTLSASSTYGDPYLPAYAVNGKSWQFWSTGGGQGNRGWLAVDFGPGVYYDITSILMSNQSLDRYPLAFSVEWSDDGSTWTTAWTGTMADQANGYVVSSASGTVVSAGGQQFRVRADALPPGGYTEFSEMLFYDQYGRGIIFSTASASSNFSGYIPARLFDGTPATQWATATNSEANAWVGFSAADDRDLTISAVQLTAGPGSEYTRSPSAFSIQKSIDGGASWTTLWSVSTTAWTSGGQVRTFSKP
ncbi:F5/8 type C domain protein [Sphingobium phage Lacusarx]|uniref:F5/8 type C domain protein n=1 Tax=Sphingobium phage Lacusarx TaxID=1980139 RepID=A0A1W6DWZ6_9CAUD|nr:virion structural protein [Sphingobium phage Lacusarx]ARK07425.1 F5/8 type C domain protein [Sphingobium phage Lacusarx]